jgi:hypothetical protein
MERRKGSVRDPGVGFPGAGRSALGRASEDTVSGSNRRPETTMRAQASRVKMIKSPKRAQSSQVWK